MEVLVHELVHFLANQWNALEKTDPTVMSHHPTTILSSRTHSIHRTLADT